MLGKLGKYMQKDETGSLSHVIYKNKFKVHKILKCKPWNYETPRRKHRQ